MESHIIPAEQCSLEDICSVLQKGYQGSDADIGWTRSTLLEQIRLRQVDLGSSFLLCMNETLAGVILMGRRGHKSRLSAFCIIPSHRQTLGGKELLNHMLEQATERGDSHIELEVSTENFPAIHLLEELGFQEVTQLVRYHLPPIKQSQGTPAPQPVKPEEVAQVLCAHTDTQLPWKLSPETICHLTPPYEAYRLGAAWCVLTSTTEQVTLHSFFVEPAHRMQGAGNKLVQAIQSQYPHHALRTSSFPESLYNGFFHRIGATVEPYREHYMSRVIDQT
jgi:ribosomal protein S18 acetylase RimI-like enzyme